MGEIIGKAEFARRLNVTAPTVSNWIARGQLDGEALVGDRIDAEVAVEQLRQRLDPARSDTPLRALGPSEAETAAGDHPAAGADLVVQQRRQRIEETEIRLARLRDEERERRGLYLRADAVRRAHQREIAQLVAGFDQLLTDLAVRLALDAAARVEMRRVWRAWRESYAQAAETAAASRPEFDEVE